MNYSMRMLQFRLCIGISFFCFKCKSQILPQNYIIVTLYLYFEMKMKGSRKSWQVPPNVQKFEIGALIPFLAPSSSPNWWQRAPRKGSHVNKYSQRIFLKKTQMRSPTFQLFEDEYSGVLESSKGRTRSHKCDMFRKIS